MRKFTTLHKLLFLTCTVALIGVTVCAYLYTKHTVSPKEESDVSFWENRIRHEGAVSAYKTLAHSAKELNASEAHRRAHLFGEALYATQGLDGLSVCDAQFMYGCLHQVVAEAILEGGPTIMYELGDKCAGDLQCLHGIGHGVVMWYGYEHNMLTEAFEACNKASPHNDFNGCESGVFMEYNYPAFPQEKNEYLRPLPLNNYHEPCDTVSTEHAPVCYYWQVRLWKDTELGKKDDDAIISTLSQRCALLHGDRRRGCMGGIGPSTISLSAYDPKEITRLCNAIQGTREEITLCHAEAGKVLVGTVSTEALHQLCNYLPYTSEQKRCIEYATTESNPLTFGKK